MMKCIDSLNFDSRSDSGFPIYEPLFDDLADHLGILSEDETGRISTYMSLFTDSGGWLSYPRDPLNQDYIVEQDGGEDGNYRWSGLMHYLVKKYRVDPPMEFREHVKRQYASGVDLEALAKELRRPANAEDAKAQNRRRPLPPAVMREREWRRLKEEGGIAAAWALYP